MASGNVGPSGEGISPWRQVKWQKAMQQSLKQFAWTPCGYLSTAATANGSPQVTTPHIASSELMIFLAKSRFEILGFLDR